MNKVIETFLSRLTYGESENIKKETGSNGVIESLARVYERARNALEYRADHLVRRAAIERIIKRMAVIDKDPNSIAKHLLTELKWARYLPFVEIDTTLTNSLKITLEKYLNYLDGQIPQEWVIKIASAKIEETFNLNTDYNDFSLLAFQVIKQKVKIDDKNSDLLVYFAVDKVYAGSDDEQIAYHILKLAGTPITQDKINEAYQLFNLAKKHKDLSRIIKFVRRQIPPLILLRDIYFYSPSVFKNVISNKEIFTKTATEVLENQLTQMSGRIATASVRSIIYVFLTKMVIAIGLEVPFEIFVYGQLSKIPLAINLVFPPALMWLTTLQNHLPKESEKEKLVERTWFTLVDFDKLGGEGDDLTDTIKEKSSPIYSVFSALYIIIFFAIFGLIYFILGGIGFSFASKLMFIFFLTIIAFFAYRISQIAKVYTWKGNAERSSLTDIISLPILAIGSRLSRGLSKLNFLAFAFDFILEAPFKIILGFLDSWVQFISVKKEEEIIE
ncbi:MAG: hypothetical protein AAB535_03585 [Patescibacteria group bacterium]